LTLFQGYLINILFLFYEERDKNSQDKTARRGQQKQEDGRHFPGEPEEVSLYGSGVLSYYQAERKADGDDRD